MTVTLTQAPQAWDGSPVNASQFKKVLVWCVVAPSVAQNFQGSPDGGTHYFTQTVSENDGTKVADSPHFDAIALYTCPGQQLVKYTGGTGGTFFIAGQN